MDNRRSGNDVPLIDELTAEVEALADDKAVLAALRRFKRRETLRIGYGDIVREQSLETVTGQISHLADAMIEAATRSAWRRLTASRGLPRTARIWRRPPSVRRSRVFGMKR